MGASIRQPSFGAGELKPALYARDDVEGYAHGARKLRNFFIDKTGAAVSRPGTRFVAAQKPSDATVPIRLVPFVYSDNVSYVLEFTPENVRVYKNGAQVLSGGVPVDIVSPFAGTALVKLRWAQSGDVLWLTSSGVTPRTLSRLSDTSWVFAETRFSQLQAWIDGALGLDWPSAPTPDASHPAREWQWALTVAAQDTASGRLFESLPLLVTNTYDYTTRPFTFTGYVPDSIACYFDKAVTLRWRQDAVLLAAPTGWDTYKIASYLVYRGRGGLFGFVGETKTREFVDDGQEPDYTRQPPQGRNPFVRYDYLGAPVAVDTPNAVALFEGRLCYGATETRPGAVFASAVDDYSNFDKTTPAVADHPVELDLAFREREEIRALLGLEKLIAFTNSSVWTISGAGGNPLSPADLIEAATVSTVGSSWVLPIVIDKVIYYARTKGIGVRSLAVGARPDQPGRPYYSGTDASEHASHLFLGYTLVDWAYAADPWGILWAVRSDGKLLSMSPGPTPAWCLHETDGQVDAVCAVPEATEDAVYLAVRRTINGVSVRYIERMTSRVVADTTDPASIVCLDSAKTYTGIPTTRIIGLSHLEGREVWALAGGAVCGPFTVAGGAIDLGLNPGASPVYVGLRYLPEIETLDVGAERLKEKRVARILIHVTASRGLWAGEDKEHLSEWKQRTVADGPSAPSFSTENVLVRPAGTWNLGGRCYLQQRDPLPLTVLGLTREVEAGG